MKSNIFILGWVCLFLMGCATMRKENDHPVFEKSELYERLTFDEIYNAAIQSLDDIEFVLRNEIKPSGFLHAQARNNPDPRYLPPHMNIMVREEKGGIRMRCHVVVPSRSHTFGSEQSYANRFFKALDKHLKK